MSKDPSDSQHAQISVDNLLKINHVAVDISHSINDKPVNEAAAGDWTFIPNVLHNLQHLYGRPLLAVRNIDGEKRIMFAAYVRDHALLPNGRVSFVLSEDPGTLGDLVGRVYPMWRGATIAYVSRENRSVLEF